MPKLRSLTTFEGREMAGARALWRATGTKESDFGKPVIAVANGGPDDFVHDFNGILIQPDQEDELVKALEKMITATGQQDSPYQSEKIVASIEEKFSYRAIAEKLESVYKEVSVCKKS